MVRIVLPRDKASLIRESIDRVQRAMYNEKFDITDDDDMIDLADELATLLQRFGSYVGELIVRFSSRSEEIKAQEGIAMGYFGRLTDNQEVNRDEIINLGLQSVSKIVAIGETLEKEQEKILPDYKELKNDINKIRDDYDTMDGLFEEFKNMKDDLKDIVKEYREAKKRR